MRVRMSSSVKAIFAAGVVVSQMLGCKDAVAPDPAAAISVSVEVAGVYPSDWFQIEVDGRSMTLPASEKTLVVRPLSAGTHTVTLVGLPPNCFTDGPNSARVETSNADLSAVEFRVSCVATTGVIAVAVSVSGYDRQLWLRSQVDSTVLHTMVKGNGTTILNGSFPAGIHLVRISIPAFCDAASETSTSVNVKTGSLVQDTALASFNIHCDPPQPGADTAEAITFERDGYIMLVSESGDSPVALGKGKRPAWSPDGKLIAFQKRNCGTNGFCANNLWLMTAAGDNQKAIFESLVFDDADAAWSPSGTTMAFIRNIFSDDATYLAVSELDGSSARILSIQNAVSTPSWSPDGAQVVFACDGVPWQGNTDLCLADPGRTCPFYSPGKCDFPEIHLTTGQGDDTEPAWSHDGHRVAFTMECSDFGSLCPPELPSPEPYIAVIDLVTREVKLLAPGRDPAWSPDDSRLVFTGNPGSPGLGVYYFADGSVRQLTNNWLDVSPSWR